MINKRYGLIWLLLLCAFVTAQAATERARFNILLFGDSVGTLTI